jgi:ferredoxin-NADP reductase
MPSAVLQKRRILAERVVHLGLKAILPFDFRPGQFITVTCGDEDTGAPAKRCYSLASAPRGDGSFDLCLKQVPGGRSSAFLQKLNEGDVLKFDGPEGDFILRSPLRNSVFIASGTGIAPVRAMVQWLFAVDGRSTGREFLVFHCGQNADGLYYRGEFDELAAQHRNFQYRPLLGGEQSPENGSLIAAVSDSVLSGSAVDIYTCGAPGLLQSCEELIRRYASTNHRLVKAA